MDEELIAGAPTQGVEQEPAPEQGGGVLEKAQAMLLDPAFEPVIESALNGAANIAAAAATLVAPIIYRIGQELEIDDAELFGNEASDGIAIRLLSDVFDIAAAAGVEGATDRGMAEQSVSMLQDLLDQMEQAGGSQPPAVSEEPTMPQRTQQPQGLMMGAA